MPNDGPGGDQPSNRGLVPLDDDRLAARRNLVEDLARVAGQLGSAVAPAWRRHSTPPLPEAARG